MRGRRLDEHAPGLESMADALRLFERICDPVAFAHAHGVIHRDLKPENVMVGPFGEVLVLDWGIAKLREQPPGDSAELIGGRQGRMVTSAGAVLGTPGYMAPEQSRGAPELDERADVHALGAILRFLLTGEAPPVADEVRGDGAPPPEIRRWSRQIPRPLEAICRKAMSPERENRYPSASEMSAEVSRFLAGARVQAYPESVLERARRFASKHRVAIVLILAYLAMRLAMIFRVPT